MTEVCMSWLVLYALCVLFGLLGFSMAALVSHNCIGEKGGDMEYEYVALTWHTEDRTEDNLFMNNYNRLYDAGWEVSLDALFEPEYDGGACIMRRPKDELRMWTKEELQRLMRATWSQEVMSVNKEETNG